MSEQDIGFEVTEAETKYWKAFDNLRRSFNDKNMAVFNAAYIVLLIERAENDCC